MSTFTDKPIDLVRRGPLVQVRLYVPQQMEAKRPPIDALAEINTAVANTCIQEGVATSLGLTPKETVKITTATTQAYECYVYHIRVAFPQGKAVEVYAVEVPYMLRPHVRIKCIIGRDVLQLGVLTYNGRDNTFSFDF
jgi:hypothetical protein